MGQPSETKTMRPCLGAACKHSLWSDAWENARTDSSTKDIMEAV
ncbi:MAG: hypothetical protein K0Q83_1425 [Deltaproteobacteria bacterium]|jgi:hypothetical protein|nr:hypothetical protein [Deltaproteobacteria bacterium]